MSNPNDKPAQPSSINEPNTPSAPTGGGPQSINEPPGSNVTPGVAPAAPEPEAVKEPLPSDAELERMKRSELDELAAARGVDVSQASNKEEVIELLQKDARKRKR